MAQMMKTPGDSGKLTADSVQAKMDLTPDQKAQLERIVLAGMKVMFDAKTHKMAMSQLEGPGTMPDKIGKAIAGLMGLLMRESRGALPPNLLIPAAMILVAKAGEFLRQGGMDLSDAEVAQAMGVAATVLLQASGVDPDKLAARAQQAQPPAAAARKPAPPAGKKQPQPREVQA